MKRYRIKGNTEIVKASCIKQALYKLVDEDGDFVYRNHWYTRSNRKAWAEFETSYGYKGIVEEV
jgi:hypothetical protein